MKNNLITILFLILVISVFISSCQLKKITPEDELNTVISGFASKSSISYDLKLKIKYFDYPDTTSYVGKTIIIKKKSDTLFGGYIWLSRTSDTQDYIKYYDSKNFYIIFNKTKEVTVFNISEPIPYGFKNNFDGRFVNTYFIKNNSLNKVIKDSTYKTKVTKINGNSQLKINYPDGEEVINQTHEITFDNSKNIIKKIIFKASIDSLHEYNEYNLTNIKFDNSTPEDLEKKFMKITKDYAFKDYIKPTKEEPLEKGEKVVNFTGEYLSEDKKVFNLEDFSEQVVILDFWFKDCPPCIKSMPQLNNIYEKYNSKGVKLFGLNNIDTDSLSREQLFPFTQKENIKYPIVLIDGSISKTYKVIGYPTLYIIDKKGKIAYSKLGFTENLEKEVDSILNIILK